MYKNNYHKISGISFKKGKLQTGNYNATLNTMYQIGSCSKFITSLVVAKLYELGKLDYDTDINKYLKKWKCPKKNITLRLLLSHTSGSSDHNGYSGYSLQKIKLSLELNTAIILGKLSSKPFNITFEPGKKFMYSGAGYQVVQQVLEEITGKRLFQLLDKYIFSPLKMKNSTAKLLYPNKHKYNISNMNNYYHLYPETAAAGIWMSCNDFKILAIDLINTYNKNSGKILSQKTLKMITKGEHPEWNKSFQNYGLGMSINIMNENKIFSHSGSTYGYRTYFHCIPEKNEFEILMVNYKTNKIINNRMKNARKILKL